LRAHRAAGPEIPMMNDMMGWMMGGMGFVWVLLVLLLILAIAALIKYLFK
jgi:hypothetical protein